ncbi:kinase-like domain-containing protein [Suillus placidus]|uniref:non-specific serine/threonine protein kinase n=1 Tax=Suillus placidus TaxID=48579 RepID=A0A9P7D893_9AGAM|nr:kinase-like domain-containing protein [Suillus placidus]
MVRSSSVFAGLPEVWQSPLLYTPWIRSLFELMEDSTSGPHLAVVYHAQNIIKNNAVAIKLEPINHSSSVEREYRILKNLEGGIGIPHALWFGRESAYHALVLDLLGPSLHHIFLTNNRKFSLNTVVNLGDQLLSRLEYIHSHNYIHGDIKPQNVVVGLGDLKHTVFLIDFSTTKEFWNTSTRVHIPFCQASTQLDFGKPDVPITHPLPCYDEPWAIKAVPPSPCPPLHRSSRFIAAAGATAFESITNIKTVSHFSNAHAQCTLLSFNMLQAAVQLSNLRLIVTF